MSHVFFIEGLPGSGKTTFSGRLEKTLKEEDYNVKCYGEGMHNPLDLAWIAILTNEDYYDVLKRYPRYSESVRAHTVRHGDDYHLAFLWVEPALYDPVFKREMETHEIYRTEDWETFLEVHRNRFASFADTIDDKTVYIFDCALLQNHLNEAMLKYELDEDVTLEYFKRLTAPLEAVDMTVFYTEETDVEKTLKRISDERDVSAFGDTDWISMVAAYVERHPAAETHGYKGKDGVIEYFKARQKRALKVLEHLDLDTTVFKLEDQEYETVFEKLKRVAFERLKH